MTKWCISLRSTGFALCLAATSFGVRMASAEAPPVDQWQKWELVPGKYKVLFVPEIVVGGKVVDTDYILQYFELGSKPKVVSREILAAIKEAERLDELRVPMAVGPRQFMILKNPEWDDCFIVGWNEEFNTISIVAARWRGRDPEVCFALSDPNAPGWLFQSEKLVHLLKKWTR